MNILNKLTLLYKYDDGDICNSLMPYLSKLFEVVYKANDLDDLLKISKENRVDVILFEIAKEDKPTISTLDLIHKESIAKGIIILAKEEGITSLQKAIEIHAHSYILNKKENLQTILKSIKSLSIKIDKELKESLIYDKLNKQFYELTRQYEIINKNIFLSYSDLDGNITDVTKAYLDFTGYCKEELIGKNHSVLKHVDLKKSYVEDLWSTISKNIIWRGEFQNIKKDGTLFWIKVVIEPLYDENGIKIGYCAIKEDITDKKRVEMLSVTDMLTSLFNRRYFSEILVKELGRAKRNMLNFCLIIVDVDYFKQYNDFYGHQAGDNVLRKIAECLSISSGRGNDFAFRIGGEEFAIITSNMDDDDVMNYVENIRLSIENLKINHEKSKVSDYVTASFGVMNFSPSIELLSSDDVYNIADKNLYEAKKDGRNRVVFYKNKIDKNLSCSIDKLTKLPDKAALFEAVHELEDRAMLMIISLNDFTHLKEQYDNKLLDNIIIEKSKDLRRTILDKETFLFRLSTNEFAILVTRQSQFEKYLSIMEYAILQNRVCEMVYKDVEYKIVINYTIGIAYGKKKLLNMANMALIKASSTTKGFYVYCGEIEQKEIRKQMLDKLKIYKEALDNDKIIPYFQPIVDVNSGKIFKYEALARLIDESGNIVTPYMFLDAVKEDKTWEYFTRQMLHKVFDIYSKNSVNLSINLTYENIASPSLIAYIKNRLDLFGGQRITFEIVESEDIKNYNLVEEFILFVKSYGCKIAIDDFGSGYSNFTNIVRLNTDYIKLDGTIIENLAKDKNVELMAMSLINFAKKAGIKTIAEFVSSKEIALHVKELGIDFVQGYEYGKPELAEYYGLKS